VTILRLRDALRDGHPLTDKWYGKTSALGAGDAMLALNAAFAADGVLVHVAKGVEVATPLLLDVALIGDAALASYPRALIVLDAGASLSIVEHVTGPQGVATQSVGLVELVVADGAKMSYARLDESGDRALSLSSVAVRLGAGAHLESLNVAIGPAVARHQMFVDVAGRDATASIRGASLLRGAQHADATLIVDHAEPGGVSRELFRTVLDGQATGVFQGKIVVRRKAQKTDGRMASNALMLSDDAAMNNKPELEIFADDVQCAHGATSGALDDDLLFYLMARGIPRKEAEALMIDSFVGETFEPLANEELRGALAGRVAGWLKARA
jgi:Fe-S cluster assembly protein SufD